MMWNSRYDAFGDCSAVFGKVAVWRGAGVDQLSDFALDTKVKDQAHKHWAHSEAALISHSNTNDVFTSDRQRGPSEFLMKALFEISNKLKLIHDFLMWHVEASRIADCFSPDEQTSTAGGRVQKKEGKDSDKFLPLSPPHILRSHIPGSSVLMLWRVNWWHWESTTL